MGTPDMCTVIIQSGHRITSAPDMCTVVIREDTEIRVLLTCVQ